MNATSKDTWRAKHLVIRHMKLKMSITIDPLTSIQNVFNIKQENVSTTWILTLWYISISHAPQEVHTCLFVLCFVMVKRSFYRINAADLHISFSVALEDILGAREKTWWILVYSVRTLSQNHNSTWAAGMGIPYISEIKSKAMYGIGGKIKRYNSELITSLVMSEQKWSK